MNAAREEHIRRVLLLELNNAFPNASKYCVEDEDDQVFLQEIFEEVKLCVRGKPINDGFLGAEIANCASA
jgi:hypothetical protein